MSCDFADLRGSEYGVVNLTLIEWCAAAFRVALTTHSEVTSDVSYDQFLDRFVLYDMTGRALGTSSLSTHLRFLNLY